MMEWQQPANIGFWTLFRNKWKKLSSM